MGKSNQNWDKGVPKHRVKSDEDEEDFDWRKALNEIEKEEHDAHVQDTEEVKKKFKEATGEDWSIEDDPEF